MHGSVIVICDCLAAYRRSSARIIDLNMDVCKLFSPAAIISTVVCRGVGFDRTSPSLVGMTPRTGSLPTTRGYRLTAPASPGDYLPCFDSGRTTWVSVKPRPLAVSWRLLAACLTVRRQRSAGSAGVEKRQWKMMIVYYYYISSNNNRHVTTTPALS